MKYCFKCDKSKPHEFFSKNKSRPDGLDHVCKSCRAIQARLIWASKPKVVRAKKKPKKRLPISEKKCYKCKSVFSTSMFYKNRTATDGFDCMCKECRKNKEKIASENKPYDKAKSLTYYHKNKHKPENIFSSRIRASISNSMKGQTYVLSELLGCSIREATKLFEEKFKDGMSWSNCDRWEIDHITPRKTAFNFEELKKLNHIDNLQPMWIDDHRAKSLCE